MAGAFSLFGWALFTIVDIRVELTERIAKLEVAVFYLSDPTAAVYPNPELEAIVEEVVDRGRQKAKRK